MNEPITPSSRAFFEEMYAANPDPWNFACSAYELSRYDALISTLQGQRFKNAFEPGCSIGVLTQRLAPHCDSLFAMDLSLNAVERARQRCARFPHVQVEQGSALEAAPGSIDLLVLSEIGYYFSADVLSEWSDRLIASMVADSTILVAHWLGDSSDHQLGGDEVHAIIGERARHHRYDIALSQRNEDFRLDLWKR
ncbi:nodulation S family protein [Granulicella cerasi]|uniref:Nodulation S family protein n=1 Tax=Granulicella cerasi TaxID=741063 RepID=A0ABW1Z803_9BACT|nr:nodulation S family protein [Granulicella cerasi]